MKRAASIPSTFTQRRPRTPLPPQPGLGPRACGMGKARQPRRSGTVQVAGCAPLCGRGSVSKAEAPRDSAPAHRLRSCCGIRSPGLSPSHSAQTGHPRACPCPTHSPAPCTVRTELTPFCLLPLGRRPESDPRLKGSGGHPAPDPTFLSPLPPLTWAGHTGPLGRCVPLTLPPTPDTPCPF